MLLQGNELYKNYGKKDQAVLRGVDIAIDEGEFVAVMGKSGSGKSTLLNLLSGLDTPTKGSVFFEGRDITGLEDEESASLRRSRFGFVFQLPKMVKHLNLLDNILLPSTEYRHNKKEALDKALLLMKKVGIDSIAEQGVGEASGGQLQRAGICRALINDPKLIFADEPTGALDSKTGEEVLRLFSDLHREGKSILMVTHDLRVAAQAERILFMKDGKILREMRTDASPSENLELIQQTMDLL